MSTILVLDANQRSALAATRSLGAAGHTVLTADAVPRALAARSRWSRDYLVYPDPTHDRSAAAEAIAAGCAQHGIDLVFPMTDVSTHLMLGADPALSLPPTPCPPHDIYETASDKGELVRVAEAAGVAVPRTWPVAAGETVTELPPDLTFPVVMKPTRSRVATQSGYLHTQVCIAQDPDTLRRLQDDKPWFTSHPWLLQEFIDGVGQGVFALYGRGQPLAWFAHRRVREKPPRGGVSVLSTSAPMDSTLRESANMLLNALAWHGPAMVEYRVAHDGTPYLMEINARFWGSLQLAISSGVDFPALAASLALGKHVAPVTTYRLGVYNRWLLGDLDNLYLTLKGSDFGMPEKLAACARFVLPWWPGLRYEVFRASDLGPFRHELAHYFGAGS